MRGIKQLCLYQRQLVAGNRC